MKKILFLSLFVFATFVSATAEKKEVVINPIAQTGYGHGNDRPRSPIYVPHILIEDNIIFFDISCIGCSFHLFQGDVIVYSDVVDMNGETQLPSNLSGVYQLHLQFGSITFIGEIEL